MAKKKKAELSDKQRKRLETLGQQWEKEDYNTLSSSLSVADLRLLLEHFSPARALIQAIAQSQAAEEEAAPPPMPKAEANLDAALAAARAEAEMLRGEVARLPQAVADALAERDAARHALAEREKELARLTAEAKAAQDKIAHMEAELRKRQSDLQEAQKEREALVRQIDDLRRQPPPGQAGDVLAFLCDRDDLQKCLSFEGLSRDARRHRAHGSGACPERKRSALVGIAWRGGAKTQSAGFAGRARPARSGRCLAQPQLEKQALSPHSAASRREIRL